MPDVFDFNLSSDHARGMSAEEQLAPMPIFLKDLFRLRYGAEHNNNSALFLADSLDEFKVTSACTEKSFLKHQPHVFLAYWPYLVHNPKIPSRALVLNIHRPGTFRGEYSIPALNYKLCGYSHQATADNPYLAYINFVEINNWSEGDISQFFSQIPVQPEDRFLIAAITPAPGFHIRIIKACNEIFIITNNVCTSLVIRTSTILPILRPDFQPVATDFPKDLPILLAQNKFNDYCAKLEPWLKKTLSEIYNTTKWIRLEQHLLNTNKNEIERIDVQIAQYREAFNDTLEQLQSLDRDINTALGSRFTLENSGNELFVELVQFLKVNKSIRHVLTSTEPGEILLHIVTPLRIFDTDLFEILIKSRQSNALTNLSAPLQLALRKIFLDQTATLWMDGRICLNFSYRKMESAYDRTEFSGIPFEGMANPHHKEFHCIGTNADQARIALVNKQFEAAVAQTIASVGGLNFADNAVISRFARIITHLQHLVQDNDYSHYEAPCIEVQDPAGEKQMLTWFQFVAQCKAELQKKEEAAA